MNTPNNKLLKVSGILLIILSTITLVFDCLSIVGLVRMISLIPDMASTLTIAFLISLVSGIAQLTVGFWGLSPCPDENKAKACLLGGVCITILALLVVILQLIRHSPFVVFLVHLVICVLYLIGAVQNKRHSRLRSVH